MSRTILFVPLDSTGHVNACIGIGEKLLSRGHRVLFAIERSWSGQLSKHAFEEVLYTDPTRTPGLGPNEYWTNSMKLIEDVLPEDSLYKAGHQSPQEMEELLLNGFHFDAELASIIEKTAPDVIISDNYTTLPAIYKSGRKWVQMTSANPLGIFPHPDTPPAGSGYAMASDRAQWALFDETFLGHYGPSIDKYLDGLKAAGLPPPPDGSLSHPSPYLNMYAYPEDLDYLDIRPLPSNWTRFEHFIRSSTLDGATSGEDKFVLPEKLANRPGKLVYVSMGSMGCADARLMQRLVDIFSDSPHRFILVLGPSYGQIALPDNMIGGKSLPQMSILPLVDLVLTHGGNNSVLETLLFGKPLLVNPLFADQYDNAQRIEEKGYGYRVNAYKCSPEDLRDLLEKVFTDQSMYRRCEALGVKLRDSQSTDKVAEAITKLANSK